MTLSEYKSVDLTFNESMFLTKVNNVFIKLYTAIMMDELEEVKHFINEDVLEYANFLCTIAKHHVVVKRPANEDPLELNKRRSSFIDGKACRFDCYYTS